MENIEQTLKSIRPSLRLISPLTYFISWGFSIFNIAVSYPLFKISEANFLIVGAISTKVWAIIFFSMGIAIAYALIVNNWKLDRALMLIGVVIKTTWLMELIARAATGKSFILVAIWGLLTYLQAITWIYFTPMGTRNER